MENKKIKILYFHHGGFKGGAPRSLAFLIKELDKEKYDPHVLICTDIEENKKLFESVGAKVICREKMGAWHGSTVSGMSLGLLYFNLKHCIPTYFQMFKVLKEIKPDIVHLNSTCLFLAAKAIKKYDKNIPVVCHVREPLLPGIWGNILRKNINKYADRFVAIEKYDADSLKTDKPVDVIYNFVDFETYNENVKSNILHKELNIPMNEKIILYLARISPENGAYEMLNALEGFIKEHKNVHFCLVGAEYENMSEYLQKVTEFAKQYNNVYILPFRNDVPEVIASSNLMIVPFTKPHFARSVIEAGAIGIPSIVSDIGGLNELVIDNKTGIIYNYKDSNDLEFKLSKIIKDDKTINELSNNAIIYAHENFDSKTNSNRTFLVYDELLNNKN